MYFTGSVHATQSEWSVYNGGPRVQLPVRHGWHGLRVARPDQQADHAQAQPYPSAQCRVCLHRRLLLHVSCLHAHETAVRMTRASLPTLAFSVSLHFPVSVSPKNSSKDFLLFWHYYHFNSLELFALALPYCKLDTRAFESILSLSQLCHWCIHCLIMQSCN